MIDFIVLFALLGAAAVLTIALVQVQHNLSTENKALQAEVELLRTQLEGERWARKKLHDALGQRGPAWEWGDEEIHTRVTRQIQIPESLRRHGSSP